jgi:hypothetical protein
MNKPLPKALIAYIEEMGVHALDHLAEKHHTGPEEKGAPSAVIALLVEQWQALSADDKQRFVERVVTSVANVIASSSRLPAGLRVGAKAVKSAAKVMKKQRKALKKEAKALRDEVETSRSKAKRDDDETQFEVPLSDLLRVREEAPKKKRSAKGAAKPKAVAKRKVAVKRGAAKGEAGKAAAKKRVAKK